MQQGFGENPTISRSHLGDLNPRPTVYERAGPEGQAVPDPGHRVPSEIDDEISTGSAMAANVIATGGRSNGLAPDRFAAAAARARSKLEEAARLIDAGDLEGARGAIGAALLELGDGRR
jgi:hypothetical protein